LRPRPRQDRGSPIGKDKENQLAEDFLHSYSRAK